MLYLRLESFNKKQKPMSLKKELSCCLVLRTPGPAGAAALLWCHWLHTAVALAEAQHELPLNLLE